MRACISETCLKRAALAAGAALSLAGCIAALRDAAPERRFDHSHHAKKGLECADCHGEPGPRGRAGMPTGASCRECHGADDTLDVATLVSAYAALPADARHVRPASYADSRFDHARHAKVACTDCHRGATSEALASPGGPMRMARCIECHDEKKAGPSLGDCRACHETLGRDKAPPSHLGSWRIAHGAAARLSKDNIPIASAERCDLCHAQTSCQQCHLREAPRDHNQAWRTTTHGLGAAIDRSRCQECHAADSCDRCHRIQPPRSHNFNFGAPRDTHCLTCHEPLSGEGCSVCHKGTPHHNQAVPKPPGHLPSMNCRQCHGAGQPLPHVDNGSECNACHH